MSGRSRYRLGSLAALVVLTVPLGGCDWGATTSGPTILLTRIPPANEGGGPRLEIIEGRVVGARPAQRVVLFARSGQWWVQPWERDPFTAIEPDKRWANSTHLGTEYAALLVEPDYRPPARAAALPTVGGGVVAVATARGAQFWTARWFQIACVLGAALVVLSAYRIRMRRLTAELNVRFEERLAERTRLARDLHDTLLQGFVSASMQLHVAVDQLPPDSPSRPLLNRVADLMAQVIEEGRNAVRGLRSTTSHPHDLEQAFSQIGLEIPAEARVALQVVVEGKPRLLRPIIRDEIYRIGREALLNAVRHARASRIEVELEYAADALHVLVRDDGDGIDPQTVLAGRDGHWGLSGMRERAEAIGGRLKVMTRPRAGTEVELSIPGGIAFEEPSAARPRRFLGRLHRGESGDPSREVGALPK